MKPCLVQDSPFQSDPCPMSLYSGLRFSSIISCRLSSSLFPTRPSRLLRDLWQLRFHSFTSRSQTLRPVKARRREEPVKEKGDEGNGSVLVKDKSGSEGRILPAELHKEATDAYMAYAMPVLLGRALPDVCDGLKPVHRRIL